MKPIYLLTTWSMEKIEREGMFPYDEDGRHSSEPEYLEGLIQNFDDAGVTVYLYELTTDSVESLIVLLLDNEFGWDDYYDFFTIKLIKSEVIQ